MEHYTVDIAQLSKSKENANDAQEGQISEHGKIPKDVEQAEDGDIESNDDEGDILGNYSIHLGALGDKSSSVGIEDREVEQIKTLCEDAGPEDFTINLKKWMRGNEKWEKQKHYEEKSEVNDVPENLKSNRADDHIDGANGENLSEQAILSPDVEDRDPAQNKNQDPEHRPSIGRSTTQLQEDAAEEVFQRISALQAEVEHMREEEENRRAEQHCWKQENNELKRENDEAHRLLRQLATSQQEQVVEQEDGLAKNTLIEDVEKLVNQNKSLRIELDTAREATDQLHSDFQTLDCRQRGEIDRLRKLVEEQKRVAETEQNKCLVLAQEAAKLAESRHHDENTIQKLADEAKARENELDHTYKEMRETRRINKDIENENDRLVQENEDQIKEVASIKKQLQSNIIELQAANDTVAELREAISLPRNGSNVEANDNAKTNENALRKSEAGDVIESLKIQHAKDLETLRSALQNAVQARQKSENVLKRSYNEQRLELQQQIATLEQQLDSQQEAPSTHSMEDELRSAIRVLSNKLEKAYASTRALRVEAGAARQEALAATETNEAVNAELEARFAEAMEAREKEWMRRANLLFREREKMGKVLLREWGRAEMGQSKKGEKQAYRYKYVRGGF